MKELAQSYPPPLHLWAECVHARNGIEEAVTIPHPLRSSALKLRGVHAVPDGAEWRDWELSTASTQRVWNWPLMWEHGKREIMYNSKHAAGFFMLRDTNESMNCTLTSLESGNTQFYLLGWILSLETIRSYTTIYQHLSIFCFITLFTPYTIVTVIF